MNRSRVWLALIGGTALFGCSALIGTRDIFLDENSPNGNEDGGGTSSSGTGGSSGTSSSGSSGTSDGGPDGSTNCTADLQTSAQHCGRCGHDCLGGECSAGKCLPKILASGLVNPNAIALDATHVYTTTYGDGRVIRAAKDGSSFAPIATGMKYSSGVGVAGNTLYWTNADFTYDDAGYWGGLFKCTLPACTDKSLVVAADMPNNLSEVSGVIFLSVRNDAEIRRVNANGSGNILVATTNSPFGLACDTNHCYYTSSQPNLYRAQADGGRGETAVGALNADFVGYAAVDNDRYYWAFTEENTGKGKVQSGLKNDIAGAKTTYGTDNKSGSVGVAVDATNVYWTNGGTFTGNTSNADGELLTCPKAGCPAGGPTLLADKLPNPWGVAVDEVAVYWVEYTNDLQQTGAIKKVAKP